VTLKKDMHFEGELDGFKIDLDADPEFGGKNSGPRPKGLLLTGLAGCTAMDVISVLRKMRSEPEEFYVEAQSGLTDTHPKIFKAITIFYHFKGGNITEEKAKKAIDLSLENYCGVSVMLSKSCPIDYKIVIDQ